MSLTPRRSMAISPYLTFLNRVFPCSSSPSVTIRGSGPSTISFIFLAMATASVSFLSREPVTPPVSASLSSISISNSSDLYVSLLSSGLISPGFKLAASSYSISPRSAPIIPANILLTVFNIISELLKLFDSNIRL